MNQPTTQRTYEKRQLEAEKEEEEEKKIKRNRREVIKPSKHSMCCFSLCIGKNYSACGSLCRSDTAPCAVVCTYTQGLFFACQFFLHLVFSLILVESGRLKADCCSFIAVQLVCIFEKNVQTQKQRHTDRKRHTHTHRESEIEAENGDRR